MSYPVTRRTVIYLTVIAVITLFTMGWNWWSNRPKQMLERYRPEAQVLVVGHTHRTFVSHRNGKTLINTGAFLPLSKAYAVDIEGETVCVRRVIQRDGDFVLGKEVATVRLH